jgi:hypothetical protein
MDASRPLDSSRADYSLEGEPVSNAWVGAMAGPLLGLLFSFTRIGPAGLIWWEGKGGETILTPLGRTIGVTLVIAGAIAGSLCGMAFDVWGRPGIAGAKPKRNAPQEHLWDRQLDG